MIKGVKELKLKPGDTAIIKLHINRLYETHRWVFVTSKKSNIGFLALGRDHNIYDEPNGVRVIKKGLDIYNIDPNLFYEESDYEMTREDFHLIVRELFENNIERILKNA